MSTRWLITGAQGLLGRYTAAYILATEPAATIVGMGRSSHMRGFFSHFVTGRDGPVRAPLPDGMNVDSDLRFSYLQADVCEADSMARIVRATRPTAVLHFASGLKGDCSADLLRVNSNGTEAVMAACLATPVPPVVVIASSGGVYGNVPCDQGAAGEDRACAPADAYTAAKLAAEEVAQRFSEHNGIRLILLRIFNVIGAGQDERHIGGSLALQITRILAGRERRILLGSLDPVRDFIDARDVAAACAGLARSSTASGVFNCCSARPTSIRELIRTFLEVSGLNPAIASDTSGESGVLRSCGSSQRLRTYGLAPAMSLLESAKSCLAYYRQVWS